MSARALAFGALAFAASAGAQERPPIEMLPTPYTWEQIRDTWRPGYATELRTVVGETSTRRRLSVVAATEETVTIRSEKLGEDGKPSGPPQDGEARWTELRDHAAFPVAITTRERADCRSPLGTLPGWRYVVSKPNGETATFCFADATPGPPIELEQRRGDAFVSRMERVSIERPSGAKENP